MEVSSNFPFTFGANYQNFGKGRNKPTNVSYDELYNLYYNDNIVGTCVNYICHQVKQFPWHIQSRNLKDNDKYAKQIKTIVELLRHPNEGPNNTFEDLISMVTRDLCVIDMGTIERVRNTKGEIKQLYYVSGQTIKPNLNAYGLFDSPAYYQYLPFSTPTAPDAEFERDELIVMNINPNGQPGKLGYGISPVELIAMTILTHLETALYNQQYFSNNNVPQAIFNLKDVPIESLRQFQMEWENKLQNKPWANAFVSADNMQIQKLRDNHQEMQFDKLNLWLTRVICAAFEIAPQNLGFVEVASKSTATTQDKMTKRQGIGNYMNAISARINHDIIQDFVKFDESFNDIEFVWDYEEKEDIRTQAIADQIYLQTGVLLPNEVRVREGMEPIEGGDTVLKPVQSAKPTENGRPEAM